MSNTRLLSIKTADSHRFDATVHQSATDNAPTLIFLPALGTPSRVYTRVGTAFAAHGINTCIPDWRGMASSSLRAGRTIDFGYRQLLEEDIATLITTIQTTFPGSPVWLGGHSLGGQLALLAAARTRDISGVVMIASGTVHLPCYPLKFRLGIRCIVALAELTGAVIGYFPGHRLGFGGRESRSVMKDWGQVARTGQYHVAGSSINYESELARLSRPVLAFNFCSDHWSPAQAAEGLLRKTPAATITHRQWSSLDTNGVELDHFSWTKHPNLIAPEVARHMRAPAREPV